MTSAGAPRDLCEHRIGSDVWTSESSRPGSLGASQDRYPGRTAIARSQRSGRRQDDAEAAGGEAEQYLSGGGEVGNLGGRQQLELRQPDAIGVRPGEPCPLQREGVAPDLLPGLAEESLRAGSVERSQEVIEQPPRSAELAVLG